MPTWTYSGSPAASPLDEVRFLAKDTKQTDASPTDDEVLYLLDLNGGNTRLTAADVADRISAEYGSRASISIDGLSLSYTEKATAAAGLATQLRAEARRRAQLLAVPFFGGTGPTYTGTTETDRERVWP